jgi:molybdopterin converting factor small subunit
MSPPDDPTTAPQSATEDRPLTVRYYAQLREDAGRSEETVQTAASSPKELYAELHRRHDFSVPFGELRVAVNGSFADWDTSLCAQDLIVFIPPVAGG